MQKVFFLFALCAGLSCLSSQWADTTHPCGSIVTAEAIEREAPSVPADPDDPDLGNMIQVNIPSGWTLENSGGDSAVMSHSDGSRAIILLRNGGCAGHVAFRQYGMDCVTSFESSFADPDSYSNEMFMALLTQPDGTSEVRYFLVDWPEAAAAALRDSFLPDRRQAVCTR